AMEGVFRLRRILYLKAKSAAWIAKTAAGGLRSGAWVRLDEKGQRYAQDNLSVASLLQHQRWPGKRVNVPFPCLYRRTAQQIWTKLVLANDRGLVLSTPESTRQIRHTPADF